VVDELFVVADDEPVLLAVVDELFVAADEEPVLLALVDELFVVADDDPVLLAVVDELFVAAEVLLAFVDELFVVAEVLLAEIEELFVVAEVLLAGTVEFLVVADVDWILLVVIDAKFCRADAVHSFLHFPFVSGLPCFFSTSSHFSKQRFSAINEGSCWFVDDVLLLFPNERLILVDLGPRVLKVEVALAEFVAADTLDLAVRAAFGSRVLFVTLGERGEEVAVVEFETEEEIARGVPETEAEDVLLNARTL
jgi:hypothetical protein